MAICTFSLNATEVRLKDVSKIIEMRDNQLIGFGLVVGLKSSGDSRNAFFTPAALKNLLSKMGVPVAQVGRIRNTAAVMVTATLPSFVKSGQRISLTVSAMGDATNLSGGTLLMTPLKGADMRVYAVAQGPVVVGGNAERSSTVRYIKNQPTVGYITDGAIVEREVPVTFLDQHNITIVLNESSFENVSRAVKAIQKEGFLGAKAIDARQIKIPLTDLNSASLIETIAQLENISIQPDGSSKIVINAKTGTIVIGERVRLSPVALTHGSVSIRITEPQEGAITTQENSIEVDSPGVKQLIYLNPSDTLSSLVDALNDIGASPRDLISIIQALKESGALIAKIEII
eukprot:COSAG01_NODE_519_length_16012_cov_4.344058_18_plen_345_part_00